MRRIALTGGIATGKSYVRRKLEALGVPTIDADAIAREALARGTPGFAAVVERFGEDVLEPDGTLDRRTLASIVFSDDDARHDLEAIVHPFVRAARDRLFADLEAKANPLAVAEIPLLYEVGKAHEFDAVIVVAAAPQAQVRRLIERSSLTEAEARQRLAAQMPIGEKVARADYVIRTDGTFEETDRQVREVYEKLRAHSGTRGT